MITCCAENCPMTGAEEGAIFLERFYMVMGISDETIVLQFRPPVEDPVGWLAYHPGSPIGTDVL